MASIENPFRSNKVEYEDRAIVWLSDTTRKIGRSNKSTYVSGTRGSGKTSILRSLSTYHIMTNKALYRQFQGPCNWFGVFFQFNEAFSQILEHSSSGIINSIVGLTPEALTNRRYIIFTQYVELKILSHTLRSIVDLRHQGFLSYNPDDEALSVSRLMAASLSFLAPKPLDHNLRSFSDLDTEISKYLEQLYNDAFYANPLDDSRFRAVEPGRIIRQTADDVISILESKMLSKRRPLVLRVLIDDCETLSKEAQTFLNSLVRTARYPVSWVLSYVSGLYDAVTTVINNQSLTDADRSLVALDNMKDAEFMQLCCNVASLRLFHIMRQHAQAGEISIGDFSPLRFFDLKARLGETSLNQIIHRFIGRGIGQAAEQIAAEAETAREFFRLHVTAKDQDQLLVQKSVPPYVEAETLRYVDNKLRQGLLRGRSLVSLKQSLANRQAISFLAICQRLGLESIPYVGFRIVIGLSDTCIRDFLDIFGEIFEEAMFNTKGAKNGERFGKRLLSFCRSSHQIDLDVQRRAVLRAARMKMESVTSLAKPYQDEILRLVEGLGELTAFVQHEQSGRGSERGLFDVQVKEMVAYMRLVSRDEAYLLQILKRAEMNGFVRDEFNVGVPSAAEGQDVLRLRLHRRFAPIFGFSFRGPYNSNQLSEKKLLQLIVLRSNVAPKDWAIEALGRDDSRRDVDPRQISLFE